MKPVHFAALLRDKMVTIRHSSGPATRFSSVLSAMPSDGFIDYRPIRLSPDEMRERGQQFLELMDARRSVREFSDEPVARSMIEAAIRAASTAPSGAHRQPWRFVAISEPARKQRIREAAEEEERAFYEHRAPDAWLEALDPLGTNSQKPFLTTAPWLVVVFEQLHSFDDEGGRVQNYYTKESVGIACGLFIAALHSMGLSTVTHTPSPMRFLNEILGRASNERPYILFPIGFAAADAQVPDLERRRLDEISVFDPPARKAPK